MGTDVDEPFKIVSGQEKVKASVVKQLKMMLEQAEAGEIVGVTALCELAGGHTQLYGSATMSRLQTAGALLECAVDRVQSGRD